nr:sigma-70 family RNA polymerase sigma factor [Allorhizobium terrae]
MVMDIETEDMPRLLAAVGRDRDVEAFETLFRHYGPRVKAYMARQSRDAQAAEELMQETMMVVWNKAALFDPARGNVSAWIFTIARNLRVSAYRKEKRPEFDPTDPAFVPDDVAPADLELESREDADRLHKAMRELPKEQMELLQRSFFHDIPHSVLAKEFNLPLGTIKSRIRLAFAKLRAALDDTVLGDRSGEGRS